MANPAILDDDIYAQARFNMVECQIKPGGVRDYHITKLIGNLPREAFIGGAGRDIAYAEVELECGAGDGVRKMLTPLAFARLAELSALTVNDVVLDIAGGTGYSAAVLAGRASTVIALEENEAFSEKASAVWQELGIDNAVAVTGGLKQGQAKHGPFDVIFINGCVAQVEQDLLAQLAPSGRLVCVQMVGGSSKAVVYQRIGDSFSSRSAFDLTAPHLTDFDVEAGFEF
jgi:protein-L-isoaspartate(D-aspartate) O-methyltransferase